MLNLFNLFTLNVGIFLSNVFFRTPVFFYFVATRFEQPVHWKPMNQGELTEMVKLTAGTAEYTAVETKFRSSMTKGFSQIVEVFIST